MVRRFNLKLIMFILIGALTLAMIWYAPNYLSYADKPVKSDIIILFDGPDFNVRLNECHKLLEEGYAENFLVQGEIRDRHEIIHTGVSSSMNLSASAHTNPSVDHSLKYSRYLEGTHREMLAAKKTIENEGLKSAIFVSSTLHMRRIKIMAEDIFGVSSLQMTFVPTRYESCITTAWFLNVHHLKMIALEYIKIFWFEAYRHFADEGKVEEMVSR